MTRASPSPRWSMASPLIPKFPRTSSSRSTRLSATTAASNHDLQKRRIPRPSSRKAESGDACIYAAIMRSRSSTTPHLQSYFLLITSIQLFHLKSYGHTFPVTEKASEPKVHEVSRYSRIFRIIELSHFSLLFLVSIVLDGFPIGFIVFLSRLSLCHSELVSNVAILCDLKVAFLCRY